MWWLVLSPHSMKAQFELQLCRVCMFSSFMHGFSPVIRFSPKNISHRFVPLSKKKKPSAVILKYAQMSTFLTDVFRNTDSKLCTPLEVRPKTYYIILTHMITR